MSFSSPSFSLFFLSRSLLFLFSLLLTIAMWTPLSSSCADLSSTTLAWPRTLVMASTSLRTRPAEPGIPEAMMPRLAMVFTATLFPVARSLASLVTPKAPRPSTRPRVKRSVIGGGGGERSARTRKSSKGCGEEEEELEELLDACDSREAAETRLLPPAEG